MGWMSWSRFFCEIDCERHPTSCINEELYKAHADRLVEDGFKDVGYTNIHIDDCWSELNRDSQNKIVADRTRFHSGIPALVDYMHKKGLKLGLYGDVGKYTCQRYPGTQDYEEIDSKQLGDWNVDYYKFDGCYSTIPDIRERYPLFYSYLNKTGKPVVFSCEWPLYEEMSHYMSNYTAIVATCNVFRNYHDVENTWSSVLDIIEYYVANQESFIPYHGPGNWFDPDMLVIGNGLTVQESRTQMSVWSVWSAPLIMSNDLRVLEPELRKILQNKEVIAVDQDPMGIMGKMVKAIETLYIFVKPMTPLVATTSATYYAYSYAIVCMNKGEERTSVTMKLRDLGLAHVDGYSIKSLWAGTSMGVKRPDDSLEVSVDLHDSVIFKATVRNSVF